jgi:peptidoglycan hydrolase-like protein with peptidoglycan-binding domain
MEPITLVLLASGGYYVYKKNQNPAWTPFASVFASPHDKVLALEKVKVTSVPTPSPTVALDPNMTSDQVRQVNTTLMTETDPLKIASHAEALHSFGHTSSGNALAAKANAVGEAKALGASDVEIHEKQVEAAAVPTSRSVPLDAAMSACEAQVLLNSLVMRQGHAHVEGVEVPIAITNEFDPQTAFLIQIFQAEAHLPVTGIMDAATARALRAEVLGAVAHGDTVTGWGPAITGFDPRRREMQERNRRMMEHGRHGRFHPHLHHHHHPMMSQDQMPQMDQEELPPPPHPHHRRAELERLCKQGHQHACAMLHHQPVTLPPDGGAMVHPHHHHHHDQDAASAADAGAAADSNTAAVTTDAAATDAASTATTGWWFQDQPMYDAFSNSGFGGYGELGYGGFGGMGGYGSWGSFGGWGHGL